MTIASNILSAVTRNDVTAVTLEYGYAVHAGSHRSLFDPARIASRRNNDKGRCCYLLAEYEDGSAIEFKYSEARGGQYREVKRA